MYDQHPMHYQPHITPPHRRVFIFGLFLIVTLTAFVEVFGLPYFRYHYGLDYGEFGDYISITGTRRIGAMAYSDGIPLFLLIPLEKSLYSRAQELAVSLWNVESTTIELEGQEYTIWKPYILLCILVIVAVFVYVCLTMRKTVLSYDQFGQPVYSTGGIFFCYVLTFLYINVSGVATYFLQQYLILHRFDPGYILGSSIVWFALCSIFKYLIFPRCYLSTLNPNQPSLGMYLCGFSLFGHTVAQLYQMAPRTFGTYL